MVVGDYINIMKTTFDFNYNLYHILNTQTRKKKEAVNLKCFLITFKFIVRKKLVDKKSLHYIEIIIFHRRIPFLFFQNATAKKCQREVTTNLFLIGQIVIESDS